MAMQRTIFEIDKQDSETVEYFTQIRKEDFDIHCDYIGSHHNITHLKLKGQIDDEILIELAKHISHFHHLVEITIYGSYGDNGLAALLEAIQQQTCLQVLVLNGSFQDAGVAALAKLLPSFAALEKLNVNGKYLDDGLISLSTTISQCALTSLEVVGWFEDDGVAKFAEAIITLPIKSLYVNGAFDNAGATYLSYALRNLPLKHLHLSGDFSDEGAIAIALAISAKKLSTLKIAGSFLVEGLNAIAYSLMSEEFLLAFKDNDNNYLQKLEIIFGEQKNTLINNVIKRQKSELKELLIDTLLDPKEIFFLAPILANNASQLEHFKLRANLTDFNTLGQFIAEMSPLKLKSLELIDISGRPKQDDEVRCFVNTLIKNPFIFNFALFCPQLTKRQCLYIAASFCNIESLRFKKFEIGGAKDIYFRYDVSQDNFTLAERYLFRWAISKTFGCDRTAFPSLMNFCTFFIKTNNKLVTVDETKLPLEVYEKLTTPVLLAYVPEIPPDHLQDIQNHENKKIKLN